MKALVTQILGSPGSPMAEVIRGWADAALPAEPRFFAMCHWAALFLAQRQKRLARLIALSPLSC